MMNKIILLGASGHAKVIIDMLEQIMSRDNSKIQIGLLDDADELQGTSIMGYPILGKIAECEKYSDYGFVIAIGNNHIRRKIAEQYSLNYITVVHPNAIVAHDVILGEGTVVMPGAVVNSGTTVGRQCIINTAATVDHDNKIANYVHISPGAHLGGTVSVGDESWLGIGSICKNNVTICQNCTIGAGSVVVKDIGESGTYVGVPVKRIK